MRVLIASLFNPFGLARLPRVLTEAGFEVAVFAPTSNVIGTSRHVSQRFPLPPVRAGVPILLGLSAALRRFRPELIIPGDDPTVRYLQRVVETAGRRAWPKLPPELLAVLEVSLGARTAFPLLTSKSRMTRLARDLGILVPPETPIPSLQTALGCVERYGYPLVVKRDFSYGGLGVRICEDEAELREAVEEALRGPSARRRLTRLARRLMRDDLAANWHPYTSGVCVQRFVPGAPMNYCGVALNGELLAGFGVRAEQTDPPEMGASTVLRIVQNEALGAAAAALVPALGFTGFFGLDFVEDADGTPHFLELNPRPTPASYLGARAGVDLCQALARALRGQPYCPGAAAPAADADAAIALFPQEWVRDPTAEILRTPAHDVPWDDPGLVAAYIRAGARMIENKAREAAAKKQGPGGRRKALPPDASQPAEHAAQPPTAAT